MRRRRHAMASINVVPYIDVMLCLLIIFMVTTPMMNQGIDIQLPRVTAEPLNQDQVVPVIVSLTDAGDYYFEQDGQQSQVTLPELRDRLALQLSQKPDLVVFVRADERVDYGSVARMVRLLQDEGVIRASLLTEPE